MFIKQTRYINSSSKGAKIKFLYESISKLYLTCTIPLKIWNISPANSTELSINALKVNLTADVSILSPNQEKMLTSGRLLWSATMIIVNRAKKHNVATL